MVEGCEVAVWSRGVMWLHIFPFDRQHRVLKVDMALEVARMTIGTTWSRLVRMVPSLADVSVHRA